MVQAVLSNHLRIATCPEPWVQLVRSAFSSRDLIRARFGWGWSLDALAGCKPEASLLQEIERRISELADQLYSGLSDGNTTYFLDKTPRYYFILEELYERYPESRFVILKRDLISVLASIKKTWLADRPIAALDAYSFDLIDGPLLLEQFIKEREGSPRVKIMNYEDIVKSPIEGFGSLFAWLDLDFEEGLLNYGDNRSFRGSLGDPNCSTMSGVRLQQGSGSGDIDELFTSRTWRRFAKGYVREVGRWNLDPEWGDCWGQGRFSTGFEAFQARHFLRKHDTPPSLRQGAYLLLDALLRKKSDLR
jgi:hypothetical protein